MIRHAKLLMASTHIDVICFLKTKTKNSNNLLKMSSSLGFISSYVVELVSFVGRFLLV